MSDAAAAIGRTYDVVPYDAGAHAGLSLARVRGAAAALGFSPTPGPVLDVLDIGCGTGAQLFLAAQDSIGRMVGVDASHGACARAAARGAALGERWCILTGDAAALAADGLGRFDVIYLVGTLYIMAEPARRRVLDLLAACLKPGGVAVVTYYTGLVGAARARLARVLHDSNDPAWPLPHQVAMARANLATIRATVPPYGVARDLALHVLDRMAATDDTVLFHEALGGVCDALPTAGIEAALAPPGLVFLNYMPPAPVREGAGSRAAALAVDAWDVAEGGGYRTALFVRPHGAAPSAGPGPRHPALVWSTSLQPGAPRDGTPTYADPASGAAIQAQMPLAQAVIEALIAAPRDWPGLCAAVADSLAEGEDALVGVVLTLWGLAAIRPEWRGVV